MMSDWIRLVLAVGIDVRRMDEIDVYLLAGKIIRDEDLRKRCLPHLRGSILAAGTRVRVIREMTPTERTELRDRILGVTILPTQGANK
jgi:hypothetical protein